MYCDLHFHTIYSSDGYNDPATVLPIMIESGLRFISPTDHDALEANTVFRKLITGSNIHLITGVELDTEHPDFGHLHILGYGFSETHPDINSYCERELAAGQRFMDYIVDAMIKDGHINSYKSLEDFARKKHPDRRLGIKQCWKWLVNQGVSEPDAKEYVSSVDSRNIKNHVCPHPREAIRAIRNAGGVAVFAHPAIISCPERLEDAVDEIISLGAIGVEAYTRSNKTEENIRRVEAIGKSRQLLLTGGSDWHASDERIPDVWPSTVDMQCGYDLLDALSVSR